MAITVQEALKLPVMKKAKLLAGEKGITRQIEWVTIVEVIEDISRFQKGEFLITTGYGLNEKSEHFLKLLRSKVLSGIAFYRGFYLKEIPAIFLETAAKYELPFIELPTNINFSDITKGILEEILNKQMERTLFSLKTHKELTQLVLKNEGAAKISASLSQLTHSSLFIFNDCNEMVDHVIIDKNLICKDQEVHYQNQWLPIKELLRNVQRKNHLVNMDWENFKMIGQPIIANEKYYGCFIIFTRIENWEDHYITTLEHGATVYAIQFLKDEAVKQMKMRLEGEFLDEMIHHYHHDLTILQKKGERFGYDLTLSQVILQIKIEGIENDYKLKETIEKLYHLCAETFTLLKKQFMISTKLDGLTILIEAKDKEDSIHIAQEITKRWKKKNIMIGVGNIYNHPRKLRDSATEATYAVDLANLLLTKQTIIHYDDLASYHFFIQMKDMGIDLKSFYKEQLKGIMMTSKHGTDYLQTLEYYFKYNFNLQLTAQNLFIHRHTLKYRLEQIEKRSGYDLSSADDRLKLQLAIAAYKLDQYFQTKGS